MVVKLTSDTYEQEVMKAEGTVLVDFYADWCGPCKMQGPIVEQLAEERTDVKFCKLNIDEAKDFLGRAGYAFSPSSKTDLIVQYFIENEVYEIMTINLALYEHDEPLLG